MPRRAERPVGPDHAVQQGAAARAPFGPPSLGDVVRRRRIEPGRSQEELAERASGDGDGLRRSDISRLELGKVRLPRCPRPERFAAALGLPVGGLLARSGWSGADHAMAATEASPSEEAPPLPADAPASTAGASAPETVSVLSSRLDDAIAQSRRPRQETARALRRAWAVDEPASGAVTRPAKPPSGAPAPPQGAGGPTEAPGR